ncbi:MAG: hypothetical protein JO113_01380 [Candidatus Eremiobacteraeota bacterium]|nr:hypothetical protein [Candidatus Eremiobacteraeota bacterium]
MSVYRVLDKLEAYVHEGTWLPAGYRILSEERLVELVEKIRASLPEEVGRAKVIAKDHERMMRAAQEKAQAIVDEAASKKDELIDENEIVQRARTTADVVLREAEERARVIRDGAEGYAADVLAEMENRLAAALGAVRKGREVLKKPSETADRPLIDAAAKSKRAAFDLRAATEETAELESV